MPNGDDKWSKYESKDTGDKWAQFEIKPTPAVTKLEQDAKGDSGTAAKLGRGFALGAAEGVGIPESTSGKEVVTGALKNVGKGLASAGAAVAEEVGSLVTDPFLPKEKRLTFRNDPVIKIADEMGKNLLGAGKESWEALKQRDPEAFAHGIGSAVTQILSLEAGEEGMKGKAITDRARLGKTAAALDIGKGEIKDLKTAMPEIVKQAQAAGIDTVGDFGKNVKKARSLVDQEFNQGLAPITNKPTVPMSISQKIRNLITPDMDKTTEGRAQIKYIKKRAVEYEKPWTFGELNAKRVTENDNLTAFYGKDTRGQAAAKLDTDISKAIRDGAADTVYQAWDKANPGGRAKLLKQRQGALWAIDDYVNSKDGFLADLEAKQLQHEGTGPMERLKTHAYISGGGPRAHLTGLTEMFSRGPEAAANTKIGKAFPQGNKTPFSQKAVAALPISVLAGKPTQFSATEEPPEPPQ